MQTSLTIPTLLLAADFDAQQTPNMSLSLTETQKFMAESLQCFCNVNISHFTGQPVASSDGRKDTRPVMDRPYFLDEREMF